MTKTTVRILDLGEIACAKRLLESDAAADESIVSPMTAVLIRHPALGNIVYDTGNDDAWRRTYPEEIRSLYPLARQVTIVEALRAEGLTPADIDMLILSHLHFDHAGGLKWFAGTRAGAAVLIPEEEARDVFYRAQLSPDGACGPYLRTLFCNMPGIGYRPVGEGLDLAPDLALFPQYGHTPGLLGLIARLESGTVIFCGDAVYTRGAYDRGVPPAGMVFTSDTAFQDDVCRLRKLERRENAVIFFGHDVAQAREWAGRGPIG